MTPEEQVDQWIDGRSVHNAERDECCPDFSCCQPHLLQPVEVRRAFKSADAKARNALLMTFLGGLFAEGPTKVYLAGKDPGAES